jgi:hypothetical protein
MQLPTPSHASAFTAVLPEQLPATHTTPTPCFAQAPEPSQTPVVPQVETGWAAHSLSGSIPAPMLPQTPSEPAPFFSAVHA